MVGSILGLWLVIGVAWGARAALVFFFFAFVAGAVGVWAVLAGHLSQRAGAGYYERQLDRGRSGRWRDRAKHRRT
jgi:fatty acid desaturase